MLWRKLPVRYMTRLPSIADSSYTFQCRQWLGVSQAFSSSEDHSAEPHISIDRSALSTPSSPGSATPAVKETETPLTKILNTLIKFRGGPISVAEYMAEALTNPTFGYYMQRDVFGRKGDFVTSPEVSQLFGEMIGVWCILQWERLGSPEKLHLVELGPGRGTLMADLLRGTSHVDGFRGAVNLHLIEVSKHLQKIQSEKLQCGLSDTDKLSKQSSRSSLANVQVTWHVTLEEVPADAPALFIAHEFFDALPAHQFVKTERGWRERLIDVAPAESPLHFQMVLSPSPTPATVLLLPRRLEALSKEERDTVEEIEVSPQTMTTAEALAKRIAGQGGAALIVDYGQDGPFGSSLQAIKQHKFKHLLSEPGSADLSCRVDFSAIRQGVAACGEHVQTHGPIPQVHLLAGLGIEARLDSLCHGKTEEEQANLITGYNRLIGGSPESTGVMTAERHESAARLPSDTQKSGDESEGMGYSYKALAILPTDAPAPLPFPGSCLTFE